VEAGEKGSMLTSGWRACIRTRRERMRAYIRMRDSRKAHANVHCVYVLLSTCFPYTSTHAFMYAYVFTNGTRAEQIITRCSLQARTRNM
jgi:hypothetical protein